MRRLAPSSCVVLSLLVIPIAVACKSKPSDGDAPAKQAVAAAEQAPAAKPPATPATSVAWSFTLPKGITAPPQVPDDNPMSAAKVELGHRLFMDKRLSVDGTRSCYSCHQNGLGNADGLKTAIGPGGKVLPRNTPTIWNVALFAEHYWEGRAKGLEAQAIGALKGGNMGLGTALEGKAAEIGALPEYAAAFGEAFSLPAGATVTAEHIARALSAYERTLLCGDTVHDRQAGDEAAQRGWQLFTGKAACITCHNGPNFSDGLYHNVGIGVPQGKTAEPGDLGRGTVTENPADNYKFRTPTLRHVSKTAPYFHDGSVPTLEEAVRLMAKGGLDVAGKDPLLADRGLTDAEVGDLVAFLGTLECPGTLEEIGDQHVPEINGAKE